MRSRVLLGVVVVAVGLFAVSGATAAPTSTTFSVVGYEYAFTSTLGCFAGTASGDAGDHGTWSACVQHDKLGSDPTYVNGGSLGLLTLSPSGAPDAVTGSFVYQGGRITTIDPGADCTNQRYRVTGTLDDVSTTTTSGGSGTFDVVLTHYRTRIFGMCVIYKAKVVGITRFLY